MAQKGTKQSVKKKARAFLRLLKQERLPIRQAYLYGSQAKGTARKDSDIDICIVSPRFRSRFDAIRYLSRFGREIDWRIEAIGYSPKNFVNESPLVWEIKTTGIRMA